MFDWQTIAVALIIAGAFVYVARRGLTRLRSFRAANAKGDAGAASCATGCGSCGGGDTKARATPLVQLGRAAGSRTRR